MRIDSSNVAMESGRKYTSVKSRVQVFTVASLNSMQVSTGTNAAKKGNLREMLGGGKDDDSSATMENSMLGLKNSFGNIGSINRVSTKDLKDVMEDIRDKCMEFLLRIFSKSKESNRPFSQQNTKQTGSTDEIVDETTAVSTGSSTGNSNVTTNGSDSIVATNVRMLSLNTQYYFEETENTVFSTTGKVVTGEGKEINFNLNLQMTRKFSEYYEENYDIMEFNMCDPLVINLDSNIPSLDDQKFIFDIDSDGIQDTISSLNGSSGYLALDKNSDGTINDGSELFGTSSGNGFKDLAEFDEDGNGWIDENDEIWNRLLIWTKDETGKDMLYHLTDKGVGAICLQNVSTDFSLNSLKTNQTNGAIRNTGIFLYENGNVGSVQHMDVAK